MPNNWKTYRLSEVSELITKGTTPSTYGYKFIDEGVNYIKSDSTSYDGKLDSSVFVKISEEAHEKLKRSQLQEDDILFSIAGAYLGKSGMVKKEHLPANTNQANAIIRVDEKIALPKFINLLLRNPTLIHYVNASSGQSAQPNLNLTDLGNLELNIPDLKEQTQIANILSAIDDKIENNLATNKTLEDMAMALYKHWFLDFGPFQDGEFIDSELGLIPKGWEVKRLDDVLEFKNQGVNTTTEKVKYSENGIPVIRANNITDNYIDTKNIVYVDAKTFSRVRLQCKPLKRDILFTNIGSQLGSASLSYLNFEYVIAWNVMRICVNENIYSPELLVTFFNDKGKRFEIRNLNSSSTMPFVSGKVLGGLNIIIPDKKNLELINIDLKRLYRKKEENILENQTLTKLRDTLLPKLISGEIRLKEFRKEVETI
jgi:type I restriction enzyme S subunit